MLRIHRRSCKRGHAHAQVAEYTAEYVIKRINAFVATAERPFFVLGLPTGMEYLRCAF